MEPVEPQNLAEWRDWLEANHCSCMEIWIVLKKGRNKGLCLSMKDAVDEALCYGWIDSRIKHLDGTRYMLRVTPRKEGTKWSERNLERARELAQEGRMTDAGKMKLPNNFHQPVASQDVTPGYDEEIPPELESALKEEDNVLSAFNALTPGRRKEFIRWVSSAKRPETRKKRILRTIELIRMARSLTEDMMDKWSNR
jgi:uncharacterized protein YdeI (YjbR/CyaY-like superfamily)